MAWKRVLLVLGAGAVLALACGRKPERLHLTVRAYDGAPLPNVPIVVHDAAGVIVLRDETGSNGKATLDVEDGSTVTVFHDYKEGSYLQSQVRTFVGVENGDSLYATLLPDVAPAPSVLLGTAHLIVPGPFTGADRYDATAVGCPVGATTSDPAVAMTSSPYGTCSSATVQPIAFAIESAANYDTLAFSLAPTLSAADLFEQTVTFPAWRTDWELVPFDLTGIPPGVTDVRAYIQPEIAIGSLPAAYIEAFAPSAEIHLSAKRLPVPPDTTGYRVAMTDTGSLFRTSSIGGRVDGAIASVSRDLSAELLPFVRDPEAAIAGSSVSVSWTTDGDLTGTDLLDVLLIWYPEPDHSVVWEITLAPDTPLPFLTPSIPDDLGGYRPSRAATGFYRGATFYDVLGWKGYVGGARTGGTADGRFYTTRQTGDSKSDLF